MRRYTCPCCGYKSLPEPPGSDGVCSVCHWHDEIDCVIYAADALGPNKLSLIDAQLQFQRHIATAGDNCSHLGNPEGLKRDPTWRLVDLSIDGFERFDGNLAPTGLSNSVLPWVERLDYPYYWDNQFRNESPESEA